MAPEFVAYINGGLPRPDLTLWLDVPPGEIYRRLRNRGSARLKHEERTLSRIAAVASNYEKLGGELERIAADRPVEEVHDSIWARCKPLV